MGTSSSLVLHDGHTPSLDAIVSAAAGKGAALAFPRGVELAEWRDLWMPVTLDGVDTGFDFASAATAGEAELPDEVRAAGPTILYFEARDAQSARATDIVREAIASLTPASTWFETLGVLVGPDGREHDVEPPADQPFAPIAPPASTRSSPALRTLFWLLDHWFLTGLVGGAIALAIRALVGER